MLLKQKAHIPPSTCEAKVKTRPFCFTQLPNASGMNIQIIQAAAKAVLALIKIIKILWVQR